MVVEQVTLSARYKEAEKLQAGELLVFGNEPFGIKIDNPLVISNMDSFQRVKTLLSNISHLSPESTMARVISHWRKNQAIFSECIGDHSEIGETQVTQEDGQLVLFHKTEDSESVSSALNDDRLLNFADGEQSYWSSRCYGLGLSCFTDLRQAIGSQSTLGKNNFRGIKITIPNNELTLIEKKSYWAAMQEFTLEHINNSDELDAAFEEMVSFCMAPGQILEEIQRLWQRSRSFDYTGVLIDAFCIVNPEYSRKSVREAIQGKYRFQNGEIAYNFGYRKHCDDEFLHLGETPRALIWMLEQRGKSSQSLNIISEILEKVELQIRTSQFFEAEMHTGWDGNLDLQDVQMQKFKKFLILMLSLGRPDLRKLFFELESDPINQVIDLIDGKYPQAAFSSMYSTNLILGTDFGSNNVAVLRHFNSEQMSFEIVGD